MIKRFFYLIQKIFFGYSNVSIFLSYCQEDKAAVLPFIKYIKSIPYTRPIKTWSEGEMLFGEAEGWDFTMMKALHKSDLLLLFISKNYIASDYCYNVETKKAAELYHKKKLPVVPIILQTCNWNRSHFKDLQAIPNDLNPILSNPDWEAEVMYLSVQNQLFHLINEIKDQKKHKVRIRLGIVVSLLLGFLFLFFKGYLTPPAFVENYTTIDYQKKEPKEFLIEEWQEEENKNVWSKTTWRGNFKYNQPMHDLTPVQDIVTKKWGYRNETSELFIPYKFDHASIFPKGQCCAVVTQKGKYGFIDHNGNIRIPTIYDVVYDFVEGVAVVQLNGRWGIINQKGEFIINRTYDKILDFENNWARVQDGDKWYYINKLGQIRKKVE